MSDDAWEKRLASIIKNFKPSANIASFRNEYRDLVDRALAAHAIRKREAELLLGARDYLESWTAPNADSATAYPQWDRLYSGGQGALPATLLEAFLRRVPQNSPEGSQWHSFLLKCSDARFIELLLQRRLVTDRAFDRLARAEPAKFYQSVALDVALARNSLRDTQPIMDECLRATPRPLGLMPMVEVLVDLFSTDSKEQYNTRVLEFLIAHPPHRSRVLERLMHNRAGAVRLCRSLLDSYAGSSGHVPEPRRQGAGQLQDVIISLIAECRAQLERSTDDTAETASYVLGLIHLFSIVQPNDPIVSIDVRTAAADLTRALILRVMRQQEESPSPNTPSIALVTVATDLHGAVQEYLRGLPVGVGASSQAPERALRLEYYRGSKAVIDQIIDAVAHDDASLRDWIEVALFNCGVRPLGDVGKKVPFDAHLHLSEDSGVFHGDQVTIVVPGRCLGEGDELLVVTKAKVRRVVDESRE